MAHESYRTSEELRNLMQSHNRDYFQLGVHRAYTAMVDMLIRASALYGGELVERIPQLEEARVAELPLLARFSTTPQMDVLRFRLTLGRVYPDNLEELAGSRLNIASISGQRHFTDLAETFTLSQIDLVATHATEVIAVDGLIGHE